MNKPSAFTMLWGHGLVFAGLCLATCWFGYLSFQDSGAILPAIIALAATASSKAAHEKRRAYHAWQREWEAMGGAAPTIAFSGPAARKLFGALCWLGMAWAALASAGDPGMALPVGLFWLVSAAVPIIGLYRLFRRAAPSGAGRRKQTTVTGCLRRPSRDNDLRQAYAALPDYCCKLMN